MPQMGRVYLPREDLQRFDYDSDDIAAHCRDERFQELMQFEVARAREYYANATRLFAHLKPTGKPIYAAMLRIYGGLLDEIERRHFDVYSERVRLPRWRKLWISLDAIVRYRWLGRIRRRLRGWGHRQRKKPRCGIRSPQRGIG